MSELYTIPKHLPARDNRNYDQRIPKTIWQTMKTNAVPKIMHDFSNSWIELNPEYEYRFFDDQDIAQWIATEFPEYVAAYKRIQHGAVKADLWRYLVLYKFGGVYADIDCRCVVSLCDWVHPASDWVTQLGINQDVCQWLILTVPGNPVLRRAAEKSRENLMQPKEYIEYRGFGLDKSQRIEISAPAQPIRSYHPVMKLAGPPVLQEAAEECFLMQPSNAIFQSTQIVCVSGNVSCQMNGNVQHDYRNPDYVQALEELFTPHYQSSQAKDPGFPQFLRKIIRRLMKFITPGEN